MAVMASPLKIVTITATGQLNIPQEQVIDLDHFFENCVNIAGNNEEGITGVSYGEKSKGLVKIKKKRKEKKTSKRSNFKKQITITLRKQLVREDLLPEERERVKLEENDFINQNIKLFPNGMVQMTGLKYYNQGLWTLFYLSVLLSLPDDPLNYQIHMINTDFKFDHRLDFDALMDRLEEMELYHVHEPMSYHGLKVSYWFNDHGDGKCHCTPRCKPKARTKADKTGTPKCPVKCKKITIIFFTTGSVIITGANNLEQVKTCYEVALEISENKDT